MSSQVEDILEEDDLARSLYEPKDKIDIKDQALKLIEITSENFQFNTASGNRESVNCLRLLGDDYISKCHDIGLGKEKKDNKRIVDRAEEQGKEPFLRTYIGFASAECSVIRAASNEYVSFDVHHVEE